MEPTDAAPKSGLINALIDVIVAVPRGALAAVIGYAILPLLVILAVLALSVLDTATGLDLFGILIFILNAAVWLIISALGPQFIPTVSYALIFAAFLGTMALSLRAAWVGRLSELRLPRTQVLSRIYRKPISPFELSWTLFCVCFVGFCLVTHYFSDADRLLFNDAKPTGYVSTVLLCADITVHSTRVTLLRELLGLTQPSIRMTSDHMAYVALYWIYRFYIPLAAVSLIVSSLKEILLPQAKASVIEIFKQVSRRRRAGQPDRSR